MMRAEPCGTSKAHATLTFATRTKPPPTVSRLGAQRFAAPDTAQGNLKHVFDNFLREVDRPCRPASYPMMIHWLPGPASP
jgi:hypothetical protein